MSNFYGFEKGFGSRAPTFLMLPKVTFAMQQQRRFSSLAGSFDDFDCQSKFLIYYKLAKRKQTHRKYFYLLKPQLCQKYIHNFANSQNAGAQILPPRLACRARPISCPQHVGIMDCPIYEVLLILDVDAWPLIQDDSARRSSERQQVQIFQ